MIKYLSKELIGVLMKLKSGFVLEKVGGAHLAVAVGERAEEFKVLIKLNSTGAFLWNIIAERDVTESELTDALLSSYEVSREIAERDVAAFIKNLLDGGLIDG